MERKKEQPNNQTKQRKDKEQKMKFIALSNIIDPSSIVSISREKNDFSTSTRPPVWRYFFLKMDCSIYQK